MQTVTVGKQIHESREGKEEIQTNKKDSDKQKDHYNKMDKESDLNILLLLMSKENPYVLAVNFIAVKISAIKTT